MTEQQLPTPTPEPTPAPEPTPDVAPKPEATGSGRYAVYNTTLGQYVGPVTTSKPKAAEAKALVPQGHKYEVREV